MTTDEHQASQPDGESVWPHHSMLLFFVLIWGGNFVLAEVALREMEPISFSVSRFVAGGVAMTLILYLQLYLGARNASGRSRLFPNIKKQDWPRLLLVSVIGATLAPWLGIEGLGLTHGARASLWLALGPAVSCATGYVLGTERIGWAGYLGILLAGLGTLALALDGVRPGQNYWFGDALLLLALVMAVLELHFIKPLAARYGATSVVTVRTAIGGLIYVGIAAPTLIHEPWLALDFWTWVAILFGGAVGVGVGQWIKVRALKKLGPTRVVLYGNLVPLAALWLAWATIGTEPSTLEVLAGFLIVFGAICIQVFDLRMRVGRRKGEGDVDESDSLLETYAVRSSDG